jgi:hypothetical protein
MPGESFMRMQREIHRVICVFNHELFLGTLRRAIGEYCFSVWSSFSAESIIKDCHCGFNIFLDGAGN